MRDLRASSSSSSSCSSDRLPPRKRLEAHTPHFLLCLPQSPPPSCCETHQKNRGTTRTDSTPITNGVPGTLGFFKSGAARRHVRRRSRRGGPRGAKPG